MKGKILLAMFAMLFFLYAHSQEDESDEIDELRKSSQQMQQVTSGLLDQTNSNNSNNIGPLDVNRLPAELQDKIKIAQQILNHPLLKNSVNFLTDPEVFKLAQNVTTHPDRKTLVLSEVGFFVFFIFFRAWRMSKSIFWFSRLWTSLWTTTAYIGGAVIGIPSIIIGNGFFGSLVEIFKRYFL